MPQQQPLSSDDDRDLAIAFLFLAKVLNTHPDKPLVNACHRAFINSSQRANYTKGAWDSFGILTTKQD